MMTMTMTIMMMMMIAVAMTMATVKDDFYVFGDNKLIEKTSKLTPCVLADAFSKESAKIIALG